MRIGQWAHFGMGGASKVIEVLSKGLQEINKGLEVIIFYNKVSLPISPNLSRFDHYKNFKLVEIENFQDLNNFNLDVLNTHRGGRDAWAFSNFDSLNYNFKIVETNFHGVYTSKKNITVYPSNTMIQNKKIPFPHTVIYNPTFSPKTEENLRNEIPKLKDKFVYGRIGRSDKGVFSRINLQAYKNIENESTAFLYVAPCMDAIREAENLKIKNIIFLPPTIDEERISKIYNTFDVFCHSNPFGETFGNTVAEAMIHSKPVVSHIGQTKWPQAQLELLGDCSELFITKDILDNYSNMMKKLMADKKYYSSVSTYLKNRAQLFQYHYIAKQYLNVYEELL